MQGEGGGSLLLRGCVRRVDGGVGGIIVHYLFFADIEDATVIRAGTELIDTVFRCVYISGEDITEMIRQFSVQDRRLRYCSGLDYLRFLQIGYPLELSFVIGISYPMLRRLYG